MEKYFKTLEAKINALSNEMSNYKNIDKNLDAECIKKKHILNMIDDIDSDEDLLNVLYKIRSKAFGLANEARELINFIENDN